MLAVRRRSSGGVTDKLIYRAFLSYSHADTRIARKVHARLEGFRIDKDLVGRQTARGPVPASLRPIFRDRNDFSAGTSLADQTLAALDASAALIVLASPHAAASRYVDEEIRLFKTRHPDRPIVPLIVGGAADAGEADYFPAALRFAVADGALTDTPAHVLAADLREQADGFLLAVAKVVARLIDVAPDLVFRRAERERRRQGRLRIATAGVVGVLALLGGLLFWQSHQQKQTLAEIDALVRRYSATSPATAGRTDSLAQAFKSIAEGAATDPRYAKALDLLKQGNAAAAEPLLKTVAEDKAKRAEKDARDAAAAYRNLAIITALSDPAKARDFFARAVGLDPSNVEGILQNAAFQKAAGNLDAAEAGYRRVVETAKPGTDDYAVFWARLGLGELARIRGHLDAAISQFRALQTFAARHPAEGQDDSSWPFALAVSKSALAESLIIQGKLTEALACYQASRTILERIAKSDTPLPARQILSATLANAGGILFAQGDLDGALRSHEAGRAILMDLAKARPEALNLRRELMVADNNIGDILLARGKLREAQHAYETAQVAADKVAAADPNNSGWQRDRAIAFQKIGNVQMARGDLAGALTSYEAARNIITPKVRRDPKNGVWQRDLSVVTSRIGSIKSARGDSPGALEAYTAANIIIERLATSDPANADLRSDLAIVQRDIASTLLAQGRLAEAIAIYRKSVTIAGALASTAADNAEWQRDLEIADNRLGNALMLSGDLSGALQAFRDGHALAERLAAISPGNADWQRDLSIAKNNLGTIFGAQGKPKEALPAFQASLAIGERLARADPGNRGWQNDLAQTLRKVGGAQVELNDLKGAEASFLASLAIDKPLAATAPDNVEIQHELAVSYVKVGTVEAAQKRFDAALASFEAGRAALARVAAASPPYQGDLATILGKIGDVQLARNETGPALDAFRQEVAISEGLAAAAPDNAKWQHELAVAYGHIAVAYDRTKRADEARDALAKGREILTRLLARHDAWADWKGDLAWFDQRIAATVRK